MEDDGYDRTDAEDSLEALFAELNGMLMGANDSSRDLAEQEEIVHTSTAKLQEAKGLVKEFEKAANFQGRPPQAVANRKKELVSKLNTLVMLNRDLKKNVQQRKELMAAKEPGPSNAGNGGGGGGIWGWFGGRQEEQFVDLENAEAVAGANNKQLMDAGRNMFNKDIDKLRGMERLVEDTKQVGTTTLATLQQQTEQMENMVNDLDDIHFNLKKASQMIRDLMKGFATDKCIMLMMAVIVCLIVTLIILKYTKVLGKKSVNIPTIGPTPAPATPAATPKARKLLTSPLLMESYFA